MSSLIRGEDPKKTIASIVLMGSMLFVAMGFISMAFKSVVESTSISVGGMSYLLNSDTPEVGVTVGDAQAQLREPRLPEYKSIFTYLINVLGVFANLLTDPLFLAILISIDLIALATIIS